MSAACSANFVLKLECRLLYRVSRHFVTGIGEKSDTRMSVVDTRELIPPKRALLRVSAYPCSGGRHSGTYTPLKERDHECRRVVPENLVQTQEAAMHCAGS
jgi:hypothetical protein